MFSVSSFVPKSPDSTDGTLFMQFKQFSLYKSKLLKAFSTELCHSELTSYWL